MKVLGIGGSDHEFSAALVEDGIVRVAIADERINRIKHGRGNMFSIPTLDSVNYCLNEIGEDINSIDMVVGNRHLEKRCFDQEFPNLSLFSHHLCHASTAFYPSPFEEAAVMVIDGSGSRVASKDGVLELETISIGHAKDEQVSLRQLQLGKRRMATCYWRYMVENSIGCFYQTMTELIGFGNRGAGITMGLSSYGSDKYFEILNDFVEIKEDGSFLFTPYEDLLSVVYSILQHTNNTFKAKADLAYATQKIFELAVLAIAKQVKKETGMKYLVYGGGCALNGTLNGKLKELTGFEQIFMHPASSDDGTSIGAALYYTHAIKGVKRNPTPLNKIPKIAFTGRKYKENELLKAFESFPVYFQKINDSFEEVAFLLANGRVGGWFEGASEIGPRALGHRSIIADASNPDVKDYINKEIKFRESFRPLAPLVLEEHVDKYFESNGPSHFMLEIVNVKKEHRLNLRSITHIDGTARIQTVNEGSHPKLTILLKQLEKQTGFPIVINTSMNIKGEPIVETPEEALAMLLKSNLDFLVMEGYLVQVYTPWSDSND